MSFSQRNTTLLRVLEIESKIKDIEHGEEYLRVKREIKVLENARNSSGNIVVSSPKDTDTLVEIRKNSAEVKEFLDAYQVKMKSISDRIDSLNAEKSSLKRKLFNA
jgi:vacuolar-type H+-ATPase subunit E/Vma4